MTPADTMRAAVEALEGAEQWLEGWASAEPYLSRIRSALSLLRSALEGGEPQKFWLWKNFVYDRPEYWAFDNAFPINLTDGDPQTLGEPCGYAIFKPSRVGRKDVSEEQVLRRIRLASIPPNTPVEAGKMGVAAGVEGRKP